MWSDSSSSDYTTFSQESVCFRLRIMQKNFLNTPELSVTCSLVDIVPVSQVRDGDGAKGLTTQCLTLKNGYRIIFRFLLK